jgi:hypothetical protein
VLGDCLGNCAATAIASFGEPGPWGVCGLLFGGLTGLGLCLWYRRKWDTDLAARLSWTMYAIVAVWIGGSVGAFGAEGLKILIRSYC